MSMLTCDTSNGVTSVVLYDDAQHYYSSTDTTKGTQAAQLVPQLDTLMQARGRRWQSLDLLACCTGPGGFTAVRIGVATIRALALAAGVPAVGVPLHDILADAARRRGCRGAVQAVYSAGRRDVVNALYYVDDDAVQPTKSMECISKSAWQPAPDAALVTLDGEELNAQTIIERTAIAYEMALLLADSDHARFDVPAPLYARAPDAVAATPLLK